MKEKIILVGLVGTAGAGKDVVAKMLTRLYGCENLSTGDLVRSLTRYIFRQPADFNPVRDQLYTVANFLRTEVNPATTVKLCLLQAGELHIRRAVISGLRAMGEAKAIHEQGGIIVAVDADPLIRYERIFSRQRDSESQKTYEQFLAQDEYENKGIAQTGDGRGVRAIIESADVLVENSATLEELEAQIRQKLGSYFDQAQVR